MQKQAVKKEKNTNTTEFVIVESYVGKKQLSDIFADLLYSAYRRQKENQSETVGLHISESVIQTEYIGQ